MDFLARKGFQLFIRYLLVCFNENTYICIIINVKNNMKKLLFALSFIFVFLPGNAKSMREMWLSMPDSLMPYMNKNLRQEMIDFIDMKLHADVKNLLGDNSRMDTLTSNYVHLTMDTLTTVEMRLLPQTDTDSLLCMVTTVAGPAKESDITFFDSNWHPVYLKGAFGGKDQREIASELISRPDTMKEKRYEDLKAMIDPMMSYAKLSSSDGDITFLLSFPMLTKEDKKMIESIVLQRKFKWDGKRFN